MQILKDQAQFRIEVVIVLFMLKAIIFQEVFYGFKVRVFVREDEFLFNYGMQFIINNLKTKKSVRSSREEKVTD
jgi:hypothetical protein